MLTEHREKLKEIWEHRNDIDKPLLDEQQLERLDLIIKEAIRDQNSVEVSYYENRRIHELEGKITIRNNSIYLNNKKLDTKNIIDIKLL